jgi:sensor c-di-GMP phosphodiesterase-like protein
LAASPLAIHVNVSALQFDDEGFIDTVTQCLRDFDVPPDQLVLEITETSVISSPAAMDRLNALAAQGVTIAIDDFGTGYSALTTLRSLPVRIVKIDKSFVAGSTVNPEDRAVTEAVVKMATQMGLRTIAEGVERLDQQAFLEAIGADAVQGYLYLRPTTAKEFGAWLGAHLAGLPRTGPTGHVVIPFTPGRPPDVALVAQGLGNADANPGLTRRRAAGRHAPATGGVGGSRGRRCGSNRYPMPGSLSR